MRLPLRPVVARAAIALLTSAPDPLVGQAVEGPVVLSRLRADLQRYESELSTLIAEERLT
ncbi:MAG: hypothetical protein ABI880_11670 [Acidobacteriota bacterium]